VTAPAARTDEALHDRDVIRRARAGSLPAFDEVMRRYEQRVLGFLLRRCSSRQDAEDHVQETFQRARHWLHLYDHRWALSTWILTVAARLCATHHRRRRDERSTAGIAERAASTAPPDESAARDEEGRNIWRLADQILTEEQRLALWLRYADDMPIKHIGQVIGKSTVATRVLLFRARAALASHMDDDAQGALAPAETPQTVVTRDVLPARTPKAPPSRLETGATINSGAS
jgi:RNA polymerase sigma-70 factor (ECF subfamily)